MVAAHSVYPHSMKPRTISYTCFWCRTCWFFGLDRTSCDARSYSVIWGQGSTPHAPNHLGWRGGRARLQAANYDRRGSPSGARMGFEASEGVRNSRLFGCWGQAGWLAGCQSDRGSTSCWRGGWIWATEAISPFTVFPTGGGDGQDSIRPSKLWYTASTPPAFQ